MILVGQYDSPNVRRVAVTLGVLGFAFDHDTRSVFGDFDSMRTVNPLGRIPSLILADGTTLIDSAAILDWLDQTVGPERALLPPGGLARQQALQRLALASGVIDKVMASAYERLVRPYVEAAQNQLTPGLIRFIHVKTRLEVAVAHLLIRGIALERTQRVAKLIADRRATKVADDFVLADYS